MKTDRLDEPHSSILTAAKWFTVLQGVLILIGGLFYIIDALGLQGETVQEPGWFFIMAMLLVMLLLPPTILLWVVGLYMQHNQGKAQSLTAPILAIGAIGMIALVASVFTTEFMNSVTSITSLIFLSVTFYMIGKQLVARYGLAERASGALISIGLAVGAYGITSLLLNFADTLRIAFTS